MREIISKMVTIAKAVRKQRVLKPLNQRQHQPCAGLHKKRRWVKRGVLHGYIFLARLYFLVIVPCVCITVFIHRIGRVLP